MAQFDDLKMIEKIRGFRATKKRKKVALMEGRIAYLQNQIAHVDQSMQEGQKKFRAEKDEILGSLVKGITSIDAIYALQLKEIKEQKRINSAIQKRHGVEEDLSTKQHEYRLAQKALWEAEKSLVKIEEFVKTGAR